MAKISDLQHKQMIAMYAECNSYTAVAQKFNVSRETVRRHVLGDATTCEKVRSKKAENTVSILKHMEGQKALVSDIIDNILKVINNPEKLEATTLPQLATTLGILVDKYTLTENRLPTAENENNLFKAIDSIKEESYDDIPEIQQEAAADADMVEDDEIPK